MSLKIVKPSSEAEKSTRTTVDTIMVTPKILQTWELPPFQRPLRVNEKVKLLAEEIKRDNGVIPGVLTVGVMAGTKYRLDGQHRIEAFLMSGLEEAAADVRFLFCNDMATMGEEFVKLNSRLVVMRPDDILRGLEASYDALRVLREKCKFLGYDHIRRGDNAPIVSMSAALRMWRSSSNEVPGHSGSGGSSSDLAKALTIDDSAELANFLNICFEAWGREPEYKILWSQLTLTLCAWLYRRVVLTQHSIKSARLTKEQFRQCLMSISANGLHLDWLVGRKIGERDRGPAYDRMKKIFVARMFTELNKRISLPQPPWASR